MPVWDPVRYLRFHDDRLRPALDLLSQIDGREHRRIHDIGCGPGNVTAIIQQRWPHARIVGSDSSPAMLARATRDHPQIEWQERDLTNWVPGDKPDVIFSNAVLHWIPDHDQLIADLFDALADGGTLAIQMPLSAGEPARRLMGETLEALSLADDLRRSIETPDVKPAMHYVDLAALLTSTFDVWTTTYHHVLTGTDPVFEWFSGSSLQRIHYRLGDEERQRFDAAYKHSLRKAYPQQADGTTVLPFPRLFMVLRRP